MSSISGWNSGSLRKSPKATACKMAGLQVVPGRCAAEGRADPHRKVFEIYNARKAREAHLGSDHFKKYKTTVETMLKSLNLAQATPIAPGLKSK